MSKTIYTITISDREGLERIAYSFDSEEKAKKRLDEIRSIGISQWQIGYRITPLDVPFNVSDFKYL